MIPVLVPRRPDGGPRDRLWAHVRPLWEAAGFAVYEGLHEDGPFNRAYAINAAACAAGEWDVAIVADADVVLSDYGQAHQAAADALGVGRLTYAHDHLTMLTETGTSDVLGGWKTPFEAGIEETRHPNTWSQCLAVPCWLWETVDGFDERFVGWGWEDLAFMSSCWAMSGAGVGRIRGDAYHLWHPRDRADNEDSPTHPANQVLGQRYLAAKTDRRAMQAILAERAG